MIYNDEGRASTLEMLKRFQATVAALRASPGPAEAYAPEMRDVVIRGHESWVEDLQDQIAEYDQLRSGKVPRLKVESFDQLGRGLIKARIAAGVTDAQLAERLGVEVKVIEDLERFDYEQASLARLAQIADILGVEIRSEIRMPDQATTKTPRSRKRAAMAAD
jgi:hypothetical protein